MSEFIVKSLPLGVIDYQEGEPLKGHVCNFGLVDDEGDVIVKGAFSESLKALKTSARNVNLYWKHQMGSLPCGGISVLKEDGTGLYLEGEVIDDGTDFAKSLIDRVQRRIIRGLSIKAKIRNNGYYYGGNGARFLTSLEPIEISLTDQPVADPGRSMFTSKSRGTEIVNQVSDLIKLIKQQ